ncbi:sensor histidine kinase [Paraflavitalea pollutisoli]|uniref:sensor histidine kinase n=1 Tax=Paraflavitalea pollutisoli TaxID=3034143 RepID=UPI0023EC2743|nr:histidine kinase [Paraflavitalea sp. H1-2-19X]
MIAKMSSFCKPIDRRLRLVGPLVLFCVGAVFFRLQLYLNTPSQKLPILIFVAISCGMAGWEMARFAALFLQQKLPGLTRIRQRLFYLLIALVLIAHIGFLLRNLVHAALGTYHLVWPTLVDYSSGMGVLIFYATVTLFVYEGGYLWKQWQRTATEKEQLIDQQWQSKFDLLKAQINPHFLFNSLNSLSTLIADNPVQAERFTNELGKVYRYLLHSSNQEMVPLAEELQFIESYAHLLRIRHSDHFQLSVDVPASYRGHLIPSLSLQLLVENAVKHNVVSKDQPLEIWIKCPAGDVLTVENRLQPRAMPMLSSGIGLSHINNKLRLLQLPPARIFADERVFRVAVPIVGQ